MRAEADTAPAPYRHIACCVDDSEGSRLAVAAARRLRALGPGRLSLVHVTGRPLAYDVDASGASRPDPGDITQAAGRWLEGLATEVPGAEAVLLQGEPARAVCAWASGADVDLLVASAHRGRVERAVRGGFASRLARHAPCQVLLVRPAAGAAVADPAAAHPVHAT
jgi:nucleotide-binding universal stress UspA family protein